MDGDLAVGRIRRDRDRHRRRGRHEAAHRGRVGERPERRRRARARQGRLQDPAGRAGARAVQDAARHRPGLPRRRRRRHAAPRPHARRRQAALALRAEHDLEGRPLRARLVRDPGHVRHRRQQGRADPGGHGRRAVGASGLPDRRGRRRQLLEGLRRHAGQGLPEGRAALAADHAPDPDHRVRRPADRRHPGRARHERRDRGARADRRREPAPARDRRHAVGDPPDRPRRRRRLLDLLHRPPAPGARTRRRARSTRSRSRQPPPAAPCSSRASRSWPP